jgi:hypothetical protein
MIEQPTRFEPPRGRRISGPVAVVGFVLAAAGALLLIALVLLTDDRDGSTAGASPSATAPTVPASASASPSAEASAAPSVAPTAPPPRPTRAPDNSLPLHVDGGTVAYQTQLAAAPGNGVYALMSAPDEVVLTQFNPDGTTRDGWPQPVASPYCIDLLVAADGSVRALCDVPLADDGLQEPAMRLFAWEANGTTIAGWPVEIAGARSAAIVGDSVAVEVRPYAGDAPPEGFIETVQLAYVDRDGSVQLGEGTVSFGEGDNQIFIGPNGTAYLFRRVMTPRKATHITAFGLDGPLHNWPLDVSGASSDPSFDADKAEPSALPETSAAQGRCD